MYMYTCTIYKNKNIYIHTHSYFVLHTHKMTSVIAILPNYWFPNSIKTSELRKSS